MHLLMIFVKNPVLGKVKTRLAATIGNEKALAVYHRLLGRTRAITKEAPCAKAVFYSDFVAAGDEWQETIYQKHVQQGHDLGERMQRAFEQAFAAGFTSASIIGSDCYELTQEVLEEASVALAAHDVVVGPSADGGYYLLGMNELHPSFFQHKAWSTATVLEDTLRDARALGLTVKALPVLTDVDEEKDLQTIRAILI